MRVCDLILYVAFCLAPVIASPPYVRVPANNATRLTESSVTKINISNPTTRPENEQVHKTNINYRENVNMKIDLRQGNRTKDKRPNKFYKPKPKCPKVCKCSHNYTVINCDRKSLTEVPQDIPTSAVTLVLSHNAFGLMKNDSFPKLPNLTSLHLDVSKITGLEPHTFRGLSNLRQLFMFSNSISNLHHVQFCENVPKIEDVFLDRNHLVALPNLGNCTKLKTLTLENNQIHSFTFPSDYEKLVDLGHLTLSLNSVPHIGKDDFKALRNSRISRLLLSRIDLVDVEDGAFDPMFKTLAAVKLSYNPLNATTSKPILKQLSKCPSLLSLDLDGLNFDSQLPPDLFEDFRNAPLTSLSLANNKIGKIERVTFSMLGKLLHLNLAGSKIGSVDPTAFQGLLSLQHLNMARNNLMEIPTLPQSLMEVNLETNQITTIKDNEMSDLSRLVKLNLHKNSLAQLRQQAFGGLKKLQELDLSNNRIDHIPKETLSPLRHLVKLNLQGNKLVTMIKNIHVFEQLKHLQFLDLSENDCTSLPYTVFRNLTSLKKLDLSRNHLKGMLAADKYGGTFLGLTNLQTLDLDSNDIEQLSPVIFRYLQNLQSMDLSHNRLVKWDKKLFTFTKKLRNLDLSNNKITIIDQFSLGTNYSQYKTLNLADNPFSCTCELVWFCEWTQTTKVKLNNYDEYTCDSPKSRQGVKLKNFHFKDLICFDYTPYIIGFSVLGGVIILLFIIILLYKFRWRISLRCYLLKQSCIKDRDYEILEEYTYDAYIACADQDQEFAEDQILKKFDKETSGESEGFQLCFEPRDFKAGGSRVKSMCKSVDNSQRAVILVTNNYLGSGYHQMELDHLHHESMVRSFALIFATTDEPIKLSLLPKWLHKSYENNRFSVWNENPDAQEKFEKEISRKLSRPPPSRVEEDFSSSIST